MLKQFKKAFTLAEVLIVIGIIGVVAALTLPNLNHATGDKEKVTRVKKIYSALTDAFDRAQVIYGDFDTWQNCESECFAKRVTEFMKVSKDCGFDDGCVAHALITSVDGSGYVSAGEPENGGDYIGNLYMVILSDGMSIAFDGSDYRFRVDIDGPNKGKNQMGVDRFDFYLVQDGEMKNQLIPSYVNYDTVLPKDWTSENVTAWVIENGNLDYLKCREELDWTTHTSCN